MGTAMHALVRDLYPICRSITGNGVRETLRRLQQVIPLEVHEVASGTAVLDWAVPKEWNITDAWVKNAAGERVIDFRALNLHILNYSVPVRRTVGLAELRAHCFTLPAQPDLVPYRTSYYKEQWGFCVAARVLDAFPDGDYEVCIESTLANGQLTWGELYLPGTSPQDVLISAHVCHPSLANDNLSGVAVAVHLAARLAQIPASERRYGYRFLFAPGTIGAITWLAQNPQAAARVRHGLVLASVGDGGTVHYKRSRRGTATIDRTVARVLARSGRVSTISDFTPFGYDERQYCSPGFDLAVGCLSRTPWGQYPEYHTSADNPAFVKPEALADSLSLCIEVMGALEADRTWRTVNPKGEPHLGRRGLYSAVGGNSNSPALERAMLWVLNLSDGEHSMLDIAEQSGVDLRLLEQAAELLASHELLTSC